MRKLVLTAVALAATMAMSADGFAKRKVTFWSFAQNNVDEYKARKADIEKKFDIEFDIQVVAQNAFVQKLQAVLMDGNGAPDIIEWMIENNRILNADPKKSFVIPLDDFVAKSQVFSKVVPGRVAWVKYGGHIYGLPHDVHPVVLIYNDTVWKSVGVDVAKLATWDEFFDAAKKLAAVQKDGKQVHYALPYGRDGLNNTMFMVWQQTGTQILKPNGEPQFTNAAFKEFVTKWLDWQKTGAFINWDWGNFKALLANGTLASYASPDWWIPQVNLASTGSDSGPSTAMTKASRKGEAVKYQFRVRDLPVYKKGGPTTASWGGSFMAIPKNTKDSELMYKIIEFIQYDSKTLIKDRWEKTGMLPPLASIWEDPAFNKPDPRFGGQKLGQLLVKAAKNMPKVNTGDIFWDAIGDMTQRYTEMAAGRMTVDQGLSSTQKRAMKRFKKLDK
ncbi:MAG: carbohydrate ABC transporter substrate-binding protein [Deltaproteobacteria bacterium]|nr:carbohydrate ABC transporter substrate-binding protein [Deltaproteobacteria bacterium]